MRVRRVAGWAVAAAACLAVAALGLDALFPLDLARAHDLSVEVTDRDGNTLNIATDKAGFYRLPATPAAVAPIYLSLLIDYEDRRFAWHPGIDPLALLRAVGQLALHGHVVSGASTLTMQVARLLEPRPRRVSSKLIEMARALQLEAHFSKREIMGLYLTLAPYGGNIEGVRAASLLLFGKEPAQLDTAEAALLVALPQSPTRLRPDRNPLGARAARDKIIDRAAAAGVLDAGQAADAKAEAIPQHRLPVPRHAPHLVASLARHGGAQRIVTTLDGETQIALEDFAKRVQTTLEPRAGLAFLVVDNPTRRIVAYIGGTDFFATDRAGQIDLVRAPRSPGSLLKPFIYGLGFDDAIIHEQTLVSDVATRFGAYAPEDFDRQFHGDVTVTEALQQSLNVPAVAILQRVGPVRFAAALRGAGAHLYFPDALEKPGLPLALGGEAIDLWDLMTLYCGLADGGTVAPLIVTAGQASGTPYRLLSTQAAGTVARILQGTPVPDGLVPAELSRRDAIAVKTGTSYGFRDAWAIGYTGDYTVGVWVGRPDGTPSPDHYGRVTAAPLVYKIFDQLPRQTENAAALPSASAPPLSAMPPPGLARLAAVEGTLPPRRNLQEPLRLVFPPDRAVLDFDLDQADNRPEAIELQASGGKRPLTWFVNRRPVASEPGERETQWIPDGEGFARITVIDTDGKSASSVIHLRKPGS